MLMNDKTDLFLQDSMGINVNSISLSPLSVQDLRATATAAPTYRPASNAAEFSIHPISCPTDKLASTTDDVEVKFEAVLQPVKLPMAADKVPLPSDTVSTASECSQPVVAASTVEQMVTAADPAAPTLQLLPVSTPQQKNIDTANTTASNDINNIDDNISSYVASQLCLPAFGSAPMSILAFSADIAPRSTPALVDVSRDLRMRGGLNVKTKKADILAARQQKQLAWEQAEQEQQEDNTAQLLHADDGNKLLPRIQTGSLADILACKWTALRVSVATPLDWGSNGPQAVTWGDLRLVAAYGTIGAGDAAATQQQQQQEGGVGVVVEQAGAGEVVQEEAVLAVAAVVAGGGDVVADGSVNHHDGGAESLSTVSISDSALISKGSAGGAASAAAEVCADVAPVVIRCSSSQKKGFGSSSSSSSKKPRAALKKGFARKVMGVAAKAVPLVATVLVAKASLLLGGGL